MGALEDYLEELRLKDQQEQQGAQQSLNDLMLSHRQNVGEITANAVSGAFELDKNDVRGLSAEETRIARERFRTETPKLLETRAQQATEQQEQAIRAGEAQRSQQNLEQIRKIASLRNMRFTDPQFDGMIPRNDNLRSEIVIDPATGSQRVQPKAGLSEQATRIREYAQNLGLPEGVVQQKFQEDQIADYTLQEKIARLQGAQGRRDLTATRQELATIDLADKKADRPVKREIELLTQRRNLREETAKEANWFGDQDLKQRQTKEAYLDLADQEKARAERERLAPIVQQTQIINYGKQLTPGAVAEIRANPGASQEQRQAADVYDEVQAVVRDKTLNKEMKGLTGHFMRQFEEGMAAYTSIGVSKKPWQGFDVSKLQPGEWPPEAVEHFMPLAKKKAEAAMLAYENPQREMDEIGGIGGDIDWAVSQASQETDGWLKTLGKVAGAMTSSTFGTDAGIYDQPRPQAQTAQAAPETMGDYMRLLPDITSVPRSSIENLVGKKQPRGVSLEEWLRRARSQGTL